MFAGSGICGGILAGTHVIGQDMANLFVELYFDVGMRGTDGIDLIETDITPGHQSAAWIVASALLLLA